MSKPVSTMAIGGFVIGGLFLLVAGILWFGGRQYFQPKARYVVYFDSSLSGLIVGAPVSVQGVQVGSVKQIDIIFDRETLSILKPVVIELDLTTIHDLQGMHLAVGFGRERQRESLDKMIAAGLRARLEMQSLLTGRLYVELSFYPGLPAHLVGREHDGYLEVPSIPTRTDELRNTLEDLVRQYRKIPVEKIVQDFSATLANLREFTGSEDLKAARRDLASALLEAHRMIAQLNRQIDPVSSRFMATADEMQGLVKDLRGDLKPLVKNTEAALTTARAALTTADSTLRQLRGTLESAEAFTAPDSNLDRAVVELRAVSRSVRDLADILERHPDAVIFGKPGRHD